MTADPKISRLERMAADLEASEEYKCLRKLHHHWPLKIDAPHTRRGLFVDFETTGLDANRDQILEIALVGFEYRLDGRICAVGRPFSQLNDPGGSIPDEVVRLTGITNEMVKGKVIDLSRVVEMVERADLILAHNASFDRSFAEKLHDIFQNKPWACSLEEVDWNGRGHESRKLKHLAADYGFFFDGHRAENDCLAAIELLSRSPISDDRSNLAELLENARKVGFRLWAEDAPFEAKDMLKSRGYRWSSGEGGRRKAWWTEVPEDQLEVEKAFLVEEIYKRAIEPPLLKLTAMERYSVRALG